MKPIPESNLDVLQNIEFSIIEVYRANRSLIDVDVKDAVDALVRHYHAEEAGRTAPTRRLGDSAERVFLAVQQVCELRLGSRIAGDSGLAIDELAKCLRQIQKSIPFWSQQGGRQGYLEYVIQFLP